MTKDGAIMLVNPKNFLNDWNRNVDNKYIIDGNIGDENCLLMISENTKAIASDRPQLKYMVINLDTSKVLAYGETPTELGLKLVNKYKGMRIEMYAVYKDFEEFYETVSGNIENDD